MWSMGWTETEVRSGVVLECMDVDRGLSYVAGGKETVWRCVWMDKDHENVICCGRQAHTAEG